jgi:hypothetical protein
MMRYVYRKGGLRPPVSPEKAAEEINRVRGLCEGDESSLPRRLWEESKKKNAPFHVVFNWNDAECGELWRTHQARMLIATVYIVETGGEGEEDILAPAFPNIAGTENRERSYEAAIEGHPEQVPQPHGTRVGLVGYRPGGELKRRSGEGNGTELIGPDLIGRNGGEGKVAERI